MRDHLLHPPFVCSISIYFINCIAYIQTNFEYFIFCVLINRAIKTKGKIGYFKIDNILWFYINFLVIHHYNYPLIGLNKGLIKRRSKQKEQWRGRMLLTWQLVIGLFSSRDRQCILVRSGNGKTQHSQNHRSTAETIQSEFPTSLGEALPGTITHHS